MNRMTTIGMDLAGDGAAPVGSRAWCIAKRILIRQLLDKSKIDHEALRSNLDEFVKAKGWTNLNDGNGRAFRTYSEFCRARPPHGLGREQADIDQLAKEAKSAQAKAADPNHHRADTHEEAGAKGGRGNKATDNIRSLYGTSADSIVRRLKRDAPEIAEALANGEYPSARAAGIAAGIVKVPPAIELAKKAYARLDIAQKQEFRTWIKEQQY